MSDKHEIETKLKQLGSQLRQDGFTENVMKQIRINNKRQVCEQQNIWRKIMKKGFVKFAAAAVIIAAALISVPFLKTTHVSAAQLLTDAIEAVSGVKTVYIKAQMRTRPADNFAQISPDLDFVPIEMWKNATDENAVKWRVEKPRRYAVCDGQFARLVIGNKMATELGRCPNYQCFDVWMAKMLDVDKLLDSELDRAIADAEKQMFVSEEIGTDGKQKVILEIYTENVGTCTDDYLTNKSISTANNTKIYTFDAETKLLEAMQLYIHLDYGDVLIFEILKIDFNPQFSEELFSLELPENVIVWTRPKPLPDNEKYENMTPKQAAQAFFNALKNEDWEEFKKFMPMTDVLPGIKQRFGKLEILSIGEPFQSCHRGKGKWFIPYKIKLTNGQVIEHKLCLIKHPDAKRCIFDGGL